MRFGRETRSARQRRAKQTRSRRLIILLIAVLVGVPLLVVSAVAGVAALGLRTAAAVEKDIVRLEDQGQVSLAETSQIYAADGTLLAYLHGVENRTVISGKEIPDSLKHAVVAVEDERFYQHSGVDAQGVGRALVANLKAQATKEGSSTITMQLVGTLFLDRTDISMARKFDEMMLAWQFEKKYSKEEILNMYLNTVYFGSNAHGVEAAARTYFNKEPMDLTLAEAALLAGLPQEPGRLSPRNNPEKALARRNLVLDRMYRNGFITLAEKEAAVAESLNLAPVSPYKKVQEPYVVAYVRKQLIDMFGVDAVFEGGLRVETTINPAYQKLATEAISSTLDREGDPASALVSLEVETGYIRAMVGGLNYDIAKGGSKFNLATQGKRQTGSSFKVFVLVAALEAGMNPNTTFYNGQSPISIPLPGATKPWRVTGGSGVLNVTAATRASINTIFAQMIMDVGVDNVIDVAHRMGITSEINRDPAIALGGLEHGVSPLEMASAFATLPNLGEHIEPTIITKVTNTKGEVLYQSDPKRTQAISQGIAYDATTILQGVISGGTGRGANIGRPAAGKTGTAQGYQDAWFVGYTPHLATAVWMGYPDAQIKMTNVHGQRVMGGGFPAEIWRKFMYEADRDFEKFDFATPGVDAKYNKKFKSGFAVTTSTTNTTLAPPSTDTTVNTPPATNSSTTTTTNKPAPTTTKPPTTTPTTTQPTTTAPPAAQRTAPTERAPTTTPTTKASSTVPPTSGGN